MEMYFGNVAVLLPKQMEPKELVKKLARVGALLDQEFIEVPQQGSVFQPREEIVGVLPRGSQWLTCCDPVSSDGFEGDIAADLAAIYSDVFGGPALAFGMEEEVLLVLGYSVPRKRIVSWRATGTQLAFAEFGIPAEARAFPKEISRLMPTQMMFPLHRVWYDKSYRGEDQRLEDIGTLFGFCILGNLENLQIPTASQVFAAPFGYGFPK